MTTQELDGIGTGAEDVAHRVHVAQSGASIERILDVQIEIVRGGPAFAECMGKHKVGEMLPAHVRTSWDERGYYRWDITKVAECDRPPMEDDVSSFEKVQECKDVKLHGVQVGFECNRQPYAELIKICPWMKRN